MTLRIAVIGNCHAQYFGAALSTLSGVEVRTVGLPYPGPICFEWGLSARIHGRDVQQWLDEGERGLVLHQMTADTRLDLYNRIVANRPYPLIRFPNFEFHAPLEEKPSSETIASDRRYNSGAFAAAGYPLEYLDRLETLTREEPTVYVYNHFTGHAFALLFEGMIQAGLSDYINREQLEALRRRIAVDRGISHAVTPLQRARYRTPLARRMDEPMEVWREMRANPLAPFASHSLFKTAMGRYRETGRPAYMGIMLTLYRQQRYHTFAALIVDLLIEKRRPGLAMLVLGRRMGWEDARGYLLVRGLKYALEFRRSPTAYAALGRFAAKYPDTTLPLLLQCCEQIRH